MKLTATGGEIYAHVHENLRTGLTRNLFWNLEIACEPVHWEGEDWECSLAIDWLTWPLQRWRELAGMNLGTVRQPELVESSLYLVGAHHPVTLHRLTLQTGAGQGIVCEVNGAARLALDETERTLAVAISCSLLFTGVIVAAGNLIPKPQTPHDAAATVTPFLSLEGLRPAQPDGGRFVFEPDV
jgi:hypothetical protein